MRDAVTFTELARRVARRLNSIEREQVCCGDITLQQFDTLRSLREAAGMTTSAIAEGQGIDLSTASRNLGVLEKHGYLSRARSKTDSRQVEHRLTAKGRRCVDSLCCDEQAVFDAIFARIPEAQRAPVLRALGTLADALEAPVDASCCAVPPEPERK